MNDDLHTFIEPELQTRIAALVLDEASEFERDELEKLIAEKPELVIYQRRMQAIHDLLGETVKPDRDPDWQLSEGKRDKLRHAFAKQGDEATPRRLSAHTGAQWRSVINIAACVLVTVILFSMATPVVLKQKSENARVASQGSIREGFDLDESYPAAAVEAPEEGAGLTWKSEKENKEVDKVVDRKPSVRSANVTAAPKAEPAKPDPSYARWLASERLSDSEGQPPAPKRPSIPKSDVSKAIAATTPSPAAVPVPAIPLDGSATADFGNGGDGLSDGKDAGGAGGGGGGGLADPFGADEEDEKSAILARNSRLTDKDACGKYTREDLETSPEDAIVANGKGDKESRSWLKSTNGSVVNRGGQGSGIEKLTESIEVDPVPEPAPPMKGIEGVDVPGGGIVNKERAVRGIVDQTEIVLGDSLDAITPADNTTKPGLRREGKKKDVPDRGITLGINDEGDKQSGPELKSVTGLDQNQPSPTAGSAPMPAEKSVDHFTKKTPQGASTTAPGGNRELRYALEVGPNADLRKNQTTTGKGNGRGVGVVPDPEGMETERLQELADKDKKIVREMPDLMRAPDAPLAHAEREKDRDSRYRNGELYKQEQASGRDRRDFRPGEDANSLDDFKTANKPKSVPPKGSKPEFRAFYDQSPEKEASKSGVVDHVPPVTPKPTVTDGRRPVPPAQAPPAPAADPVAESAPDDDKDDYLSSDELKDLSVAKEERKGLMQVEQRAGDQLKKSKQAMRQQLQKLEKIQEKNELLEEELTLEKAELNRKTKDVPESIRGRNREKIVNELQDRFKTKRSELADVKAKPKQSAEEQESVAQPARPKPLPEETLTSAEPFSTFSLNVNDVSFKLARVALLEKGQWPDSAKVRTEEFVNAFDYGDPSPRRGEPVACAVDQAAHPFLQQRNLLRIGMKTAAMGRSQPLRLTVLLDNSGSMEREDREASVLAAMQVLAAQLGPQDVISVVGFARQPRLIADRVRGDQAKKLVDLIAKTPSEGGTNIEEALRLAQTLAKRQHTEGAQSRVVLVTDGIANLGNTVPEELSRQIEAMRQQGIAFDACGVGAEGLNDDILEALTRKGDGRYYFLNRPADADAGFAKQLAGALTPAAKNVKVQVVFNPKRVTRYRLLGFNKHRLNKQDFRNDRVDAAEMAAEEAGNAVYQVQVNPQGEGELGEVFVRFLDASTGRMVERSWPLPYEAQAKAFDLAAPSMQLAGTAAMLGEKLHGTDAGSVRFSAIADTLGKIKAHYASDTKVQDLIRMCRKVK